MYIPSFVFECYHYFYHKSMDNPFRMRKVFCSVSHERNTSPFLFSSQWAASVSRFAFAISLQKHNFASNKSPVNKALHYMTVCATAQEAPAQSGHSVTNNPYVLAVCMADKRTQQTVLSHDDNSLAHRDYQICFFFSLSTVIGSKGRRGVSEGIGTSLMDGRLYSIYSWNPAAVVRWSLATWINGTTSKT